GREGAVGLGRDGGDEVHLLAGAGDEDVEAAPAAGHAEGAEASVEASLGVRAVGGGDDDVVALVALDVLEVLDEESLEGAGAAPVAGRGEASGEGGVLV